MNAKDLKNSILQLAIQGKLVEQRKEEGTAKELLERIKTEKEQLIKEGKIKREKPLPEITEDEIPFDIPESWEWVRHNELFEVIGGSQPPKSFFEEHKKDDYIRLYQIRDYGDKPSPIYVPKSRVTKFTESGDILLARYGASIGKVFIAEDGAYNVAMAKSKPLFISELIYKKFIYYYYLAPLYQSLVRNNSRSAQAGFNKEDLFQLLLPLPPLEEQKRIVTKIEELMPYVEKYGESHSKLEEFNRKFPEDMQKSILQYAIQGKLVEQREEEGTAEELYQQIQGEKAKLIKEGKIKKENPPSEITEDEIPFEIPESWKWVRLGEVTSKLTDGSHNPPPNTGSGYFVISAKNIKNNEITFENVERYTDEKGFLKENPHTNISRGDIILGIIGGSIGNIAIYEHDERVIAQRSIAIINTLVSNQYIKRVIQSPLIQFQLKSSSGTAQGGVYLGTLSKIVIPLPPLEEQERIVAKIEELSPNYRQLVK